MRRIALTLAGFLLLGLAGSAVWASPQREMVVGSAGEIYAVKSGLYGELFPSGKETATTDPVLALDITKPDGTAERLLVNGTGGPDVESLPFLLFEESSKTLFLVWEARVSVIHPILMLAGYNGTWIEPFEIIGNPFSLKNSPQFAVTQDNYEEQGPEGPVSRHRTILHLVWGEETGNGLIETFYTPVFLESGQFVGRFPIYALNDLELPGEGRPASPSLAQTIRVQHGRDERTIVVAFVSQASGRLNTLEIDALPMQLSLLADGARAHIIDLGAKLYPSKLKNLAEEARAHIIDLGRSFHPVVSSSLAAQAQSYISSSSPSTPLKSIADGARAHIIDLGAKLSGRGLKTASSMATPSSILEVQPSALMMASADVTSSPQLLQMQMISSRSTPEVGRDEIKMFVSQKGQDVLLAWIDGQRVLYVETQESGWSEIREIRLTAGLDSASALKMLEQRVFNR